jgi:methyltransferase family protein
MPRRDPVALLQAGLDRAIERWLGVRTAEGSSPENRDAGAPNQIWYTPSEWIPTWRALARTRPRGDDVLLDYGAGLGRALVVGRTLPFSKVIGVEISPQLAAAARANVANQSRRVRCEAEVVEADAAAWPVPDDVTVVYMYSPFTGPVFEGAVGRVLESIDRRPRRARLVYTNPAEHNFLIKTGRFRPIEVVPATWPSRGGRSGMVTVTYDVLPERTDDPSGDARLGAWASYTDRVPDLGSAFSTSSEASSACRMQSSMSM